MTLNIYYSHVRTIYNQFGRDLPRLCETTWPELCDKLVKSANSICDPQAKHNLDGNITTPQEFRNQFGCEKWDYTMPSIMSAIYTENSARKAKNVEYWGNLAIVDIDNAPITFNEMVAFLDSFEINYFVNTTTSHSKSSPHFRVYLPLDRTMDISEVPDLWSAIYLMLKKMPDEKTKGLSRLMYMPRAWIGVNNQFHFETNRSNLVVDDTIKKYASKTRRPRVTSVEKQSFSSALSSATDADIIDLDACRFVTESAISSYNKPKGGRFFGFLNRVAFAALRDGYNISAQELFHLGLQADAQYSGDTEKRKVSEAVKAIDYASANIIAFNRFDMDAEIADFKPPVKVRPTDTLVYFISGECGGGKTFKMLDEMVNVKGKRVFACDKIISIGERVKEFNEKLNNHHTLSGGGRTIAQTTTLKMIFSEKKEKNEYGTVELVDDAPSVMERIAKAKTAMEDEIRSGDKDNAVIFITHRAMQLMNWNGWEEWELIIDETPDVVGTYSESFGQTSKKLLRQHLDVVRPDDETYILKATPDTETYLSEGKRDAFLDKIKGLLMVANDPNSNLWVMKKGWDALYSTSTEDVTEDRTLTFFSLFSHQSIKPFKKRYVLGDQFLRSRFYMAWSKVEGVAFRQAPFWFGGRERRYPLRDRATIHYFCDDNASFIRFEKYDRPLKKISEWLNDNQRTEMLYTCNERFKPHMDILEKGGSTYITPKAHGRNDLQHFTTVAGFAAMKSSGTEYNTSRTFFGMTASELNADKELNALYQFVLRGILRDFESSEHCDVYVFSKAQAEYLQQRLGGCKILKVKDRGKDVIENLTKQSAGRPVTVKDKKAANKGYQKTYRNKVNEGKAPKSPRLSDAERKRRSRKRKKDAEEKARNSGSGDGPTGAAA